MGPRSGQENEGFNDTEGGGIRVIVLKILVETLRMLVLLIIFTMGICAIIYVMSPANLATGSPIE